MDAIASGLTRSEAVSPDEDVTFLPQPTTNTSTAAMKDMVEMMLAQRFTGCPPLAGPLDRAPVNIIAGRWNTSFEQ